MAGDPARETTDLRGLAVDVGQVGDLGAVRVAQRGDITARVVAPGEDTRVAAEGQFLAATCTEGGVLVGPEAAGAASGAQRAVGVPGEADISCRIGVVDR
jgi:hypothetical protein